MRCRVDFNFCEWWQLESPWEGSWRCELETDEVIGEGEPLEGTSADRGNPRDTKFVVD